MGPDLVLNDLSFAPPAPTRDEARRRMDALVSTLTSAVKAGAAKRFRLRPDYQSLYLAERYTLHQWQMDESVKEPVRRYTLTLRTMTPPLDDLPDHNERHARTDYRLGDQIADSLGTASEVEGLAVSLRTGAPEWEAPMVTIARRRLDRNGDWGSAEAADVHHASAGEHVSAHIDWIRNVRQARVSTGRRLWEQKEVLFPSLLFCEKSSTHILKLGSGYMVKHLIACFEDLEAFCKGWTSGEPDFTKLPGEHSDESDTVKNDPSLQREREYICPDGVKRLFTYHMKGLPDYWRVYIHGDAGPAKLFIGPVGWHLRTKKSR